MLQASRQLEGYLSQERYNLNRMNLNDNVSNDFLSVKVDSYNGLVTTLNHLFTVLTGVESPLFERYALNEDEEQVVVQLPSYVADAISLQAPVEMVVQSTSAAAISDAMTELGVTERSDDPPSDEEIETEIAEREKPVAVASDDDGEKQLPLWVLDGYPSHDAWVEDKEAESKSEANRENAEVVMDVGMSQYRANQILTEYSETAEQDIDTYVPEDDVPASVFPSEHNESEDDGDPDRSTRDLRYLNHTADDTRIDTDPTQITRVETAVEREGVNGSRGPDIDIESYSYQSPSNSLVDSLISDEISKLRKPSADASDEE